MVRQLHDGMTARVTDNGTVSEAFAVTNGVKQGCVLAPTLFSFMFSAMLMDAYRDEQPGIRIAYRNDGHLLNSRRMQTSTHVSTTTVHDLLFADDCALNTVTEEDMQRSMDLFAAGCADDGLTISTAKTVFMHQQQPSAELNAPKINVNGAQLKTVENFAYLGSTLSRNTRINDEVAQRISKAGLRPVAGLRVESPRYSSEHQTEDIQGRHLDDNPLRSGDLDRLFEPSQEAESLPSQLPPQNTDA
ncbi:unnamed protein product [Schistocephalus solidus]|uniref:Reverse transcriptase domain-containing protein n=1 Tax=Schistocephalus solidus TaxID=70667 RepID=A0A183TBM0_SCHSO|nr:unnamed protein product [Schistocephalus solidus]